MPYAALSPARFGLLCKSSTGFAVLASLLFVGMAPPSLAQSPLAIPSDLGSAALLASGPSRVTVHPRPRVYRRCTRWYLVQYSPSPFSSIVPVFQGAFSGHVPGTAQPVGPPLQREYATGFLPTGVRQSLCRVSNLRGPLGPRSRGLHAVNIGLD